MKTRTFELLLRFADGREEVRITDHLDRVTVAPGVLEIAGRRWRVTETTPASRNGVNGRLVCVPSRNGDSAPVSASG